MRNIILILILTYQIINAQEGNSSKGLTYYKYILKPMLGYNGAVFSKKYTTKEWEVLFANEAKEFKVIFSKESNETKDFLNSKKFKKIKIDLEAFVKEYSKDSHNVAQCED